MRLRRHRPTTTDYRGVLVGAGATGSAVAEAYRMLRTGLLIARGADRPGAIAVTSAGPRAGKSVTVANLALVLAKTERSVLVIDADMRSASQGSIFGQATDTRGLSELLESGDVNAASLEASTVEVGEGVDLLVAGGGCDDPSERLSSVRFQQLLDLARDQYDVVLIDTAPVGLVTDAAVLARIVDGVVFVVDYEDSRRRFVQRAVEELRKADANILGTVLNRYHDDVIGNGSHGGPVYGEAPQQVLQPA